MTVALLAGVAGLALLDALNPATIAGVALLLLAPMGCSQGTAETGNRPGGLVIDARLRRS